MRTGDCPRLYPRPCTSFPDNPHQGRTAGQNSFYPLRIHQIPTRPPSRKCCPECSSRLWSSSAQTFLKNRCTHRSLPAWNCRTVPGLQTSQCSRIRSSALSGCHRTRSASHPAPKCLCPRSLPQASRDPIYLSPYSGQCLRLSPLLSPCSR